MIDRHYIVTFLDEGNCDIAHYRISCYDVSDFGGAMEMAYDMFIEEGHDETQVFKLTIEYDEADNQCELNV